MTLLEFSQFVKCVYCGVGHAKNWKQYRYHSNNPRHQNVFYKTSFICDNEFCNAENFYENNTVAEFIGYRSNDKGKINF